ncbi:MAG: FecR domain-containing protein [Alphaproteobacteria bacterium]|nr:FecR domain-containing protein [Alphaproteobacteria bacterium]
MDISAEAQERAGVTAAVRGRVELAARAGEVGRLVKSGEPVFLGNAIKSGPEAGLQLLLLDQTTFTIGPDSEITIDEFVYDPSRGSGKVGASVAKGVFRFVTGKVAQNNPADMVVKLPVGTIGIRGTIAMGSVDRPNAQSLDGLKQQVVLVGPGSNVDSSDRIGAIVLDVGGGGTVTINQPGFGSQLGFGGQGWGGAIRFTPEMIAAIQNKLSPPPPPPPPGGGQQGGSGGQATDNAGAGATVAKGEAQQFAGLSNTILFSTQVNSDANNQQFREEGSSQQQRAIDGITTIGQLQQVTSGQVNYTQSNVPLFTTSGAQSGTYSLGINVDFGSRQIATPGSYLDIKSPLVSGNGIPNPVSYANMSPSQFAVFFFGENGGTGEFVGSGCGASQSCEVNLGLVALNAGGKTGANLLHALSVLTDKDEDLLSGFGIADQAPGTVSNPNPIANGTSTYEQLRTINSGQFYYSQNGVPLSAGGSYNMAVNIDFGARTVGGLNSKVVVNGTGYGGTFNLGSMSFASGSGPSNFVYTSTAVTGGVCATNCNATFQIAPQNADNSVGITANHNLVLKDFSNITVVSQGNGTAGRTGGFAP